MLRHGSLQCSETAPIYHRSVKVLQVWEEARNGVRWVKNMLITRENLRVSRAFARFLAHRSPSAGERCAGTWRGLCAL